jgi:Cu/Ag efflux pump CusA
VPWLPRVLGRLYEPALAFALRRQKLVFAAAGFAAALALASVFLGSLVTFSSRRPWQRRL